MAKFWKFLAISIVFVVCMGLLSVPAAPTALAVSWDAGLVVQPSKAKVGFNESFTVNVSIDNSDNDDVNTVGAIINFTPGLINVTAITVDPTWTLVVGKTYDNTKGWIDIAAGIMGSSTNASSIPVATIDMVSNNAALSGIASIDIVVMPGVRESAVMTVAHGDILNWTMVVNGTVIVGPAFNLTVTSVGCCPITVGGLGTVAANSNGTFVVPCPNVILTADDTAGSCSFANWTVDGNSTTNESVIVTGTADTSHTAVARCTVVALATLEGHVSFPGRGSNNTKWAEPFNVTLFQTGNLSHVLWAGNATTNNTGVFTIAGLTPGTYDIGIKNWTCLSEVNTSVTLSAGSTTVADFGTTREGDSNNDDSITGADRSLLYSGWSKSQGQGGYNVHYDFNRDGSLGGPDRSLMYFNWAQHGDLP